MKWAIYILLLCNLAIFVWHFQPDAGKKTRLVDDHLTRLVLLKEYEQQLQLTEKHGSGSSCYSLGPFTRRENYDAAREQMLKHGINIFGRVSSDSVRSGYWVMLPASLSRNQALVEIQKLKEKGIEDYFLIDTGEMKNGVSLGVFSKPRLAKRRQEAVKQQGFRPIIKKIAIPNRVYWLEWPRRAKHQPDKALLESLRAKFEGIGQTEKQCVGVKNS